MGSTRYACAFSQPTGKRSAALRVSARARERMRARELCVREQSAPMGGAPSALSGHSQLNPP